MKFTRIWAMPSKATFTIKPIKELLNRYVSDGKGWIDPFAGNNSPAEFTNDLNPETKARVHKDAISYSHEIKGEFKGCLFDPPYSYHQIKEVYDSFGLPTNRKIISPAFYAEVVDAITPKIKPGGVCVSFGWNSQGFGKNRGFEIIEILLVPHGAHHNDTIVTVERKINHSLKNY